MTNISKIYQTGYTLGAHCSWSSASRKLTPASSFRYRTKKMLDCVSLVRYRTGFGIVSFFQSGTGLTGCRTVRHSGISIYMSMDIDIGMKHWHGMQHWHEHATWTWTCSMDMDMDTQHGFGYAVWTWTVHMHGCTDAGMPECRWKAQSGIVIFPLVYIA